MLPMKYLFDVKKFLKYFFSYTLKDLLNKAFWKMMFGDVYETFLVNKAKFIPLICILCDCLRLQVFGVRVSQLWQHFCLIFLVKPNNRTRQCTLYRLKSWFPTHNTYISITMYCLIGWTSPLSSLIEWLL